MSLDITNRNGNTLDINRVMAGINSASGLDTRWAYTALDVKFKDHAVPDEILIDKETGQFFYKRIDGDVVSYMPPTNVSESMVYINEINNAITGTINSDGGKFTIPDTPSNLLVNMDVNIDETMNTTEIISGITFDSTSFKVSPDSNGIFAKIKTRPSDVNYVELLTSRYNTINDISDTTNATIRYRVKYTDMHSNIVYKDYSADIRLNKLEALPFISRNDDSTNPLFDDITSDIAEIEITFLELTAVKLSQAYDPSHMTTLPYSMFIADDGRIIIDSVDVSIFIDDMDKFPTTGFFINSMSPSSHILTETKNSGGMTEAEKTEIEELKNTVANLPKFTISNSEVDKDSMNVGDIWAQIMPVANIFGNTLNVTATNTTFNKEELEKFLIENPEVIKPFSLDRTDSNAIFIEIT